MEKVIMSNDMELEVQETWAQHGGAVAAATVGTSSTTVTWERFLPKTVVRVLLVESDVSTRKIIAALLRKCSYRVAAVSDGLKAWELLKGRPHNIDLILTEVDLPSVSGYALLSLIMEHDICQNIPVIMMSSNDSVSTVYKCMLKGAADFLVKPLRKNELRNVWQHVWRKQVTNSAAGLGPPDENEAQQKVEATAENNVVSNSSGYLACTKRNRECIEKASDAQSSCTKPDGENKAANTEHVLCISKPNNVKFLSDDINIRAQEECHRGIRTKAQADVIVEKSDINRVIENSSREAIDFIGSFDNYLKGTFRSIASDASTNNFDILLMTDLASRNHINDESHTLNHSDVSAFSRYVNKPLQATCSNHQKNHETNSEKQFSNYAPDLHGMKISLQPNHVSVVNIQSTLPEITFPYPHQREISLPIPVKGVRFENSDFYPLERQNSSHLQFQNLMDLAENEKGQKLENLEEREQVFHVNDWNGNSSFCTGKISHHHIRGSECGNEEGREGSSSHRSMLREAALTKFRLKRKDRCFDKKVRYESRKRLAEQRPRVKGQFVRQVPNDHQSGNSSVD